MGRETKQILEMMAREDGAGSYRYEKRYSNRSDRYDAPRDKRDSRRQARKAKNRYAIEYDYAA